MLPVATATAFVRNGGYAGSSPETSFDGEVPDHSTFSKSRHGRLRNVGVIDAHLHQPIFVLQPHALIGRADRNPGNSGNRAGHGDYGYVTIIFAGRSRRVALDAINHPMIQTKVASDRFEALPPCVVRLNTLVCYDGSDKIDNALVAAFRKQRAIVGGFNEAQQAQIAQVPMHGHQPICP